MGILSSPMAHFSTTNPAFFFAMFATQIGNPKGNIGGEVHIWTRVDENFDNSNSTQSFVRGSMSILLYQTVLQTFSPGVITFMFSAFTTSKFDSLGLIATSPTNELSVPGIIFSVIQLSGGNDTIPFGELLSTKTQLPYSNASVVTLIGNSGVYGIDATTAAKDGVINGNESSPYFALTNVEIGSAFNIYATSEAHLWMNRNSEDIPNCYQR